MKQKNFVCVLVPSRGLSITTFCVSESDLRQALVRLFERRGVDVGSRDHIRIGDVTDRENSLCIG